jgi:hypothetical protein
MDVAKVELCEAASRKKRIWTTSFDLFLKTMVVGKNECQWECGAGAYFCLALTIIFTL